MRFVAKSHTGQVRSSNEDRYRVDMLCEGAGLLVVADGMGGCQAGEVASELAVKVVWDTLKMAARPGADWEGLLRIAFSAANTSIFERARSRADLSGMGTTLTACVIDGLRAHVAHVGDSRAYLMRDESLIQITNDHSVVAEMVRNGQLTQEEARNHPQRSVLTRAAGAYADVDVDLATLSLRAGDTVLLCTDGLSNMLSEQEILRVLQNQCDLEWVASELVRSANLRGGYDNITVVLARVPEVSVS
ncbi:MAG: Stp1/IreP family PP2C-type Ser/Thr phosphatase [Bacillota bacterium]